jgi:hypothetical protein
VLDEALVNQMLELRGDEDNTLWRQGDILRDNALTLSETKQLADRLQLKASTLNARRRVSTETPNDKRNPNYAWSIYNIFVRIEDHDARWQLMFSRKGWTIKTANESVRRVTTGTSKVSSIVSKTMVVGDVMVKGRLENDGTLTLKVFVGDNYEHEITTSGRYTTIEFTK